MLTLQGCQSRQDRLLRSMEEQRLDFFLTGNYRTAYYFTGSLSAPETPVLFGIRQDGRSLLITSATGAAQARETETYSIDRAVDEPFHEAAGLLRDALRGQNAGASCAVERAATSGMMEQVLTEFWPACKISDAGPVVRRLRKRKEEDEIEEIRASLRLIRAAYDAARAGIQPGRAELDVYNEMQAAVVNQAGTFVQLHGDFATGERGIRGGGPPTPRVIAENDLYILDLFPAPALYFGDTCRTFAASTPTDLQHRAWEAVTEAVRIGEQAVKPGVRSKDVYWTVKNYLDAQPFSEKSFWHHAGHGIGHHGHESPRIIPGSDDVFEVGDVFTLEPGIYTSSLHGGIRLEDNYVVREHGIENLFDYPREL